MPTSPDDPLPVRPWMGALAWGILSFFGFVVSVYVFLPPIGQLEQVGMPRGAALGLGAFAWTTVSGIVALAAARATLGRWPPVTGWAVALLVVGAVAAGVQLWLLTDWAIGRFAANDPEYVGPAWGLFAVVAGTAVAGFGVQVGPRGSRWPAVLGLGFGLLLALGLGIQYLPRLLDGVAPSTVAPAISSVAACAYVGFAAAAAAWRLIRPTTQ